MTWWCPYCESVVQPDMVNYDFRHDERSGGCGKHVRVSDNMITDNTAVIRTLEARIAELEAENQRLREAAQAVVDSATPHYDRWVNGVTRICINRLKALLGGGYMRAKTEDGT